MAAITRSFMARAYGGLVLLGLVCGCTSTRTVPPEDVVMCSKCEMVWVERLDPNDPYLMTYISERTMKCPDCVSAVASFFKTGRFEHTCASCGDQLIHCTVHR